MYIPAAFEVSDLDRLHAFIESHAFAVVTTTGPDGLTASHVPVLLDRSRGASGTLVGHLARANEQVRDFDHEALAIFSGPHAYISPTWYDEPRTVPTWNYVAVHASGILRRVEDPGRVAEILAATVDRYESSRTNPWPFDPTSEFHQQLSGAVVGFEIEIARIQGKWKLNQNHSTERRMRAVKGLEKEGTPQARAIADLMRANLPQE